MISATLPLGGKFFSLGFFERWLIGQIKWRWRLSTKWRWPTQRIQFNATPIDSPGNLQQSSFFRNHYFPTCMGHLEDFLRISSNAPPAGEMMAPMILTTRNTVAPCASPWQRCPRLSADFHPSTGDESSPLWKGGRAFRLG